MKTLKCLLCFLIFSKLSFSLDLKGTPIVTLTMEWTEKNETNATCTVTLPGAGYNSSSLRSSLATFLERVDQFQRPLGYCASEGELNPSGDYTLQQRYRCPTRLPYDTFKCILRMTDGSPGANRWDSEARLLADFRSTTTNPPPSSLSLAPLNTGIPDPNNGNDNNYVTTPSQNSRKNGDSLESSTNAVPSISSFFTRPTTSNNTTADVNWDVLMPAVLVPLALLCVACVLLHIYRVRRRSNSVGLFKLGCQCLNCKDPVPPRQETGETVHPFESQEKENETDGQLVTNPGTSTTKVTLSAIRGL